jgi:hypothetical protein
MSDALLAYVDNDDFCLLCFHTDVALLFNAHVVLHKSEIEYMQKWHCITYALMAQGTLRIVYVLLRCRRMDTKHENRIAYRQRKQRVCQG